MRKSKDLVGQTFDYLTVIKKSDKKWHWECRCKCGVITDIYTGHLGAKGGRKSCGCLRKELVRIRCWKGCGEISGSYWCSLRNSAKKRGLTFDLTIEDAWNIFEKQNKKCGLSGMPIYFDLQYRNKRNIKRNQTASLDRIDSSKGYTKDNVMWVDKRINELKSNKSNDEFIELCRKVSKHNGY